MLKKILILMIIGILGGILGGSFSVLSWAGTKEEASPPTIPSMRGGTESDATSQPGTSPNEEGYLLGPGDVLDISVWKDEALTRSCVVRPDGFISFPLIGEIRATGRTASQIKREIEERLNRYVPGVTLSLEIRQINSLIIYVIGKANTPGRFVLNTDVNVLQALSMAGGLNIYAKRNKIKIFRHGSNETTIYPFEYDDVVEGKHLEQNIYLRRGDVVVIP
jgi:polysaccharide export outer membrane protein